MSPPRQVARLLVHTGSPVVLAPLCLYPSTVTSHENRTITTFPPLQSAQELRSLRPWVRLNGMSVGSIPAKRFLVI